MFTKKILSLFSLFVLSFMIFGSIAGYARSEFINGDSVSANKTYDNLYIAGSNITVDGQVEKDLLVAGGTVTTTSPVYRDIIVAGGTVNIKSAIGSNAYITGGTVTIDTPNVSGNMRVAGGTVTVSGNFSEDVMIGAGDTVIKNAKVNGDVYVGTGTLTVINSTIKGKIQGEYSELKGDDLKSQVLGKVDLKKSEKKEDAKADDIISNYLNISWLLSVAVVTLIVGWILGRRNRLAIPSIKFDGQFGIDILIGLGAYILPIFAMIILFIVQLFPVGLLLISLIYLLIAASMLVLPIYIGNFLRNTFSIKLAPKWMTLLGFVFVLLLGLVSELPYLGLLGIISLVFSLAHTGFMFRKVLSATKLFLTPR